MDPFLLIFMMLAVGGLFWMNSRAKRQQRQQGAFRDNLQVGQEVMTGSGLFGTITAIEDDVITLASTPGNETRWLRAAIAKLVDPPVEATTEDDDAVEGSIGSGDDATAAPGPLPDEPRGPSREADDR